jgi:hypothetical protein
MEFTVTIRMGNEGMSDEQDVSNALYSIAKRMALYGWERSGRITNPNGNVVGEWGFRKS